MKKIYKNNSLMKKQLPRKKEKKNIQSSRMKPIKKKFNLKKISSKSVLKNYNKIKNNNNNNCYQSNKN